MWKKLGNPRPRRRRRCRGLRRHASGHLPGGAQPPDRRPSGRDLPPAQRLPTLDCLVALRAHGRAHGAVLLRPGLGNGSDLRLEGTEDRRGTDDDPGEPARPADRDRAGVRPAHGREQPDRVRARSPAATTRAVRWSMEGTNTLRGKMLVPFMERLIGKQFAEGLANLDLAAREVAQRPSMEGRVRLDQPGVEPAPFH